MFLWLQHLGFCFSDLSFLQNQKHLLWAPPFSCICLQWLLNFNRLCVSWTHTIWKQGLQIFPWHSSILNYNFIISNRNKNWILATSLIPCLLSVNWLLLVRLHLSRIIVVWSYGNEQDLIHVFNCKVMNIEILCTPM